MSDELPPPSSLVLELVESSELPLSSSEVSPELLEADSLLDSSPLELLDSSLVLACFLFFLEINNTILLIKNRSVCLCRVVC